MNGPEHYREAERLIAGTDFKVEGEPFHNPPTERDVAEAQIHATLAQAAATALLAELFATRADINHTYIDAWADAVASTATLDAAADAEFTADTEGQR
jgi:hypothetical protein